MDNVQRAQEDEATRRLLGTSLGGQSPQVFTQPQFAPSTPIAATEVNRAGLLAPLGSVAVPRTALDPVAELRAQQDFATRDLLGGNAQSLQPTPAASAPGGGLLTVPQTTVGPLTVPQTTFGPLASGVGLASESNLLGGPLVRTAEQDDATRRLLGAPTTAGSLAGQTEGLTRRRLPNNEDPEKRATSREAKRAAERAEDQVTCFRVVINGEIESAQLSGGNRGPLMCVFSVQHGADWTVVSGTPNGITQLACSAAPLVSSISATIRGGGMREVVWNFPIGLVLKTTSPFGWPRIAVTVYGTDLCNRRVVKGYGSVHIPCQPGRHSRVIRLYCPLSSSPLTRLMGALFGNPAQLVDPRVITGTEGREVVRVQTGGKVRVVFEVLLKDTEPFNYTF